MDIVKISRSLLVQYANYSIDVLSFLQTPKEMTSTFLILSIASFHLNIIMSH